LSFIIICRVLKIYNDSILIDKVLELALIDF